MPPTLEKSDMEQLLDLACQLSPENLSCDGEASKTYVRKRLRELNAQWAAIEARLGRKVTEEEVWDWERKQSG